MSHPSTWAVVVPSFNHADDAIACLESLRVADPRPGHVLLVDDASTDDAVERIEAWAKSTEVDHQTVPASQLQGRLQRSAWLTLARADQNSGFVASCNIGLRRVRDFTAAPFVLLLNNDAVVTPAYFGELALALEKVPDVGLLTGSIYEWDRSTVWYAGGSFNPLRAVVSHGTRIPTNPAPVDTGFVCGCSMLISRRALVKVGFLAESFQPVYFEDVDYSLRVKAAGFRVMMAPNAVCYHRVGKTLGRERQSPRTAFSVNRNRAFTLRRNFTGWRRAVGMTYLAVSKPGRALIELARGHPRTAWAVLTGTLVGVFSRSAVAD